MTESFYQQAHRLRDGAIMVYRRGDTKQQVYQARLKVPGVSGYVIRSLKTRDLPTALNQAEDMFYELRAEQKLGMDVRVSAEARDALSGISIAMDAPSRAAAWREVQASPRVGAELAAFMDAAERRLGSDGLRTIERTGRMANARIGSDEDVALAEVASVVRAVRPAERAAASERQRLSAGQSAGRRSTLK